MADDDDYPVMSAKVKKSELAASIFPNDTSDRGELFRAVLAEFLATTMFVFLGTLSVAATGEFLVDDSDLGVKVSVARVLPIATTFGLSITVLAFNIGPISGGHINPAVTYALMLIRKISPWRSFLYMVAQFLGAVLGSALMWGGISNASYQPNPGVILNITGFRPGVDVVPGVGRPPFGLGATQLNPILSVSNGLLLEMMGTSFLIGTVLSTAVDTRSLGPVVKLAPIPIGMAVWIAHLGLIAFTGCGINPARTFGSAFVGALGGIAWDDSWWIYYLGPFLGSTFTVGVMHVLWGGSHPPNPHSRGQVVDDMETV
jgi:MIP family channel proteins